MIMKRCSKPGCINHIPRSQRPPYCVDHQRINNRTYDDKRDPKTVQFYHSAAWKQFRIAVLNERHHLCEVCISTGELTPADTVHHIVEIKKDWSRRLDRTNVQVICRACHNKEHKRGFLAD